jgi:TctA family transporter
MDVLHNLAFGFEHALTWQNLLFCAIGCVVGTLVGLLPGLGPLATISILLPLTYSIPTGGALIMLAGIYYGAQYGDSVSAITMKIPHASSIVACIDGYKMTPEGPDRSRALHGRRVELHRRHRRDRRPLVLRADARRGRVPVRPGRLLRADAGRLRLRQLRHHRQPPRRPRDVPDRGAARPGRHRRQQRPGALHARLPFLAEGIGLVSIALGCFGIAEITKNLDNKDERTPFNGKIHLMPTWPEFKRIIPSALRGSVVGSALGILPGGGPTIAQFAAYAIDKKVSKYKHEIGTGVIEGVAGQAAADEAAARTSFIPLMSIGIPENAVMALMMAAFIIKGIQPGPNMIAGHPDLFWGLVASMWVGNVFLVVLNVPLVRYWLSVFKIPYAVLFPSILFFCCIGTFSVNNNLDDIFITALFGFIGYIFLRLDLDPAPLLLGFILGPMLEENFRRALLISRGSFNIFVTRPISGTLLAIIAAFVAWQIAAFVAQSRRNGVARSGIPAAAADVQVPEG